ncbi:MAG: DUF5688 family protein [Lachnospiraceae bacterium]|nr:DUF5688 family protein [Lachnospiraceae bacterium]
MLNIEEFQDYTKRVIKNFLPEELAGATVRISDVTKNNGLVLHGITVQPEGSNIAPNIYLDGYFKEYEDGAKMEEVLVKIARVAAEHLDAPSEFGDIAHTFTNFKNVKDRIIMVVVNTEKNREMLEGMPHQNREDLSLIYKVALGNNADGMATVTIKNEHMREWGVTPEEIHELAMENTKELLPVTVQSMNEIMREMFGRDGMPDEMAMMMFEEMPMNQQMYVISNESKINGAASMFYEDALSGLAEKVGTDLYILPSSVHEVIAVSTDMGEPECLAQMVQEVNGGQVSAEEQLSDHVYRFDANSRTIFLADTTMEKLMDKVSENTQTYDTTQTMSEGTRPHYRR